MRFHLCSTKFSYFIKYNFVLNINLNIILVKYYLFSISLIDFIFLIFYICNYIFNILCKQKFLFKISYINNILRQIKLKIFYMILWKNNENIIL